MDAIRDRNLLFGVLAVQLRGVSPAQLVEVSAAWAADPSVSVPRRLVDKGALTEDDRALLERLVDDAIRVHGGHSEAVLELFGGEEHVEKTFFSSFDAPEPHRVGTSPMEGLTFFTGSGREISGVHETPGRYTLVSHHEKGGMGRVLIVHDEYLGRNIALKELLVPGTGAAAEEKPSPVRQSAALVARFLQEARITSQLEHPAIVPVYELGRRQDGSLYYTMRLVRGKTFATALQERKTLDERLRLLSNFVSLCQAMAYSHSRGVIHRDIKPANVMLGSFGETVVLDWGLAKVHDVEDVNMEDIRDTLHFLDLDEEHALPKTAYGRALGTPHYMPIEQAEGRIDAIDERSDVYSLGAVLYEILTGAPPYSGKSTHEIIDKVIHTAHVPVLKVEPEAPPELAVITEKALQKDPARRYQSAAELAEEVQRFIDGRLVHAFRYSLRQIAAHYYAKHRMQVNAALAVAAVLLAVFAGSYVSILNARNREHNQRLAAETARRSEAEARGVAERNNYQSQIHLVQSLIREKDLGRATDLLWATSEKERGWEWRYLLTRANPDVCTVEAPNSNLFSAVFSPDGSKIGTNTYPEPPTIRDAQTGRELTALEGGGEKYSKTSFSPDGTKYMGISLEGAVNVWDAVSGRRLHQFQLNAAGYSAAFDSTGDFLYAGAGDGKVHVFDLLRGAPAHEFDVNAGPVVFVIMSPRKDRLLTGNSAGAGQLWDLAAKAPLFPVTGEPSAFSPDGARIATIQGAEAVVWDAETGTESARLKGHSQGICSLRFNGDGSRLLSASLDGSVLLWDTASAQVLQTYTLPSKTPAVFSFFLAREEFVLACFDNNQCVLFNAQTGSCISQVMGRGQRGMNMADLRPDGALLAISPDEHAFQVINPLAPTGVESTVAGLDKNDILSSGLSSTASGKLIAFHRYRDSVRLVDTEAKKGLCSFSASYEFSPNNPVFSEDGSKLAMIVDEHVAAAVSNPASGRPTMASFEGHTSPVASIALRPDGNIAASGGSDGTICLWDSGTGEAGRRWKAHNGTVTGLQFSRDGKQLLSCGLDGALTVWSCGTGERTRSFARQEKGIAAAAFNADETRVLTVDQGGNVQLWDAINGKPYGKSSTGRQVESIAGRWADVEVRFMPDGRRFLTQYPGEGSRLWDADTMTPLLFFDPDERVLPFRGDLCLATADRLGNLRTIRLPGAPGESAPTRESFQQYQAEWASRTAVAAPEASCQTYMFISQEDLARGMAGLIQLATALSQSGPAAFLVEAGSRTQAMAAMGLNEGDAIVAVDNTALSGAAAAKPVIENAAGRLSQDPRAGLGMSVLRNGQERLLSYWTFPLAREQATVSLTRTEALGWVQREIDVIASRLAASTTEAWIPLQFPQTDAVAAKTTLAEMVYLVAVEDVRHDSAISLKQALISLKQRIASGETVQFSQTFRAGAYREQARTFTVAGGQSI